MRTFSEEIFDLGEKFGIQGEYEARYNEDDGEIEIFQYKNIVDADKDHMVDM